MTRPACPRSRAARLVWVRHCRSMCSGRKCRRHGGYLFKVLREGKASVVTDHIQTFTEPGIALKYGRELEADIVVAAGFASSANSFRTSWLNAATCCHLA